MDQEDRGGLKIFKKKFIKLNDQLLEERANIAVDYRKVGKELKSALEKKQNVRLEQYVNCDDADDLDYYAGKLAEELQETSIRPKIDGSYKTFPTYKRPKYFIIQASAICKANNIDVERPIHELLNILDGPVDHVDIAAKFDALEQSLFEYDTNLRYFEDKYGRTITGFEESHIENLRYRISYGLRTAGYSHKDTYMIKRGEA